MPETSISNTGDNDYVYDLYCHINQGNSQAADNRYNVKSASIEQPVGFSTKNVDVTEKNLDELVPLPDFQSTFGHVTTNIVGCDWKSAQEYLALDSDNDGMPSWWHRGSNINSGTIYNSIRVLKIKILISRTLIY